MTSKEAWPKVAVLFDVSGLRRLLVPALVSIGSRHAKSVMSAIAESVNLWRLANAHPLHRLGGFVR